MPPIYTTHPTLETVDRELRELWRKVDGVRTGAPGPAGPPGTPGAPGGVQATRRIDTLEGIQGGGDLSVDRTHKLDLNGLTYLDPAAVDAAADYTLVFDFSATLHKKTLLGGLANIKTPHADKEVPRFDGVDTRRIERSRVIIDDDGTLRMFEEDRIRFRNNAGLDGAWISNDKHGAGFFSDNLSIFAAGKVIVGSEPFEIRRYTAPGAALADLNLYVTGSGTGTRHIGIYGSSNTYPALKSLGSGTDRGIDFEVVGAAFLRVSNDAGVNRYNLLAVGGNHRVLTTKGDVFGTDGTTTQRLAVGTDGQVLTADSTQALGIKWAAGGGGGYTDEQAQDAVGTILLDSADIDFTYDDATPSITGVLTATGVTPGSYGSASNAVSFTVDGKGRLTAASTGAIAITASQVTNFDSAVIALLTDLNIPDTITITNITQITNRDHGSLQDLGADDHTQYALLAGRSGGQTLIGGTAASNNLVLQSTSNATRGSVKSNDNVVIGAGGAGLDYTLTFDGETNDGVLTWMQGADYFKFSDDILMNSTERIYFGSIARYIYSSATDTLDIGAGTVYIRGINDDVVIQCVAADPADNWLSVLAGNGSAGPILSALGASANIDLQLQGKGTGNVRIGNSSLAVDENVGIGSGAGGVDYTLTFNGENNDGVLTWMEDEDYFKFSDDILLDGTERLYFSTTAAYAYATSAGNLLVAGNTSTTLGVIGDIALGQGSDSVVRKLYPLTDLKVDLGISGTNRFNDAFIATITTRAGAGTGAPKVGGTLTVNTSAVGNVGTGEDDLMTYSVPAATLNTNGERITFAAAGTIANNANAKRLRVKFGATTILDTGAAGIPVSAAIDWALMGEIIRTGAATQKAWVMIRTNNTTFAGTVDYTTPAETLSGAVVLKLTGEATSNNDIVQELFRVEYGDL